MNFDEGHIAGYAEATSEDRLNCVQRCNFAVFFSPVCSRSSQQIGYPEVGDHLLFRASESFLLFCGHKTTGSS